MIKIERTSVMNLDNAIRGARNPMNSWAKSDSYYDDDDLKGADELADQPSDDPADDEL